MRRRIVVLLGFVTFSLGVPAAARAQWQTNGAPVCTVSPGYQIKPSIITDGAAGAVIAWSDFRTSPFGDVYVQRLDGNGFRLWPADGKVVAAPLQQMHAFVTDGAGGAIVVWQDDFKLFARRVLGTGALDPAWPANGLQVCTNCGVVGVVAVADGTGGAIVAWSDGRNDAGTFSNYDVYAQHILGSGSVDPGWTVDGVPVCTDEATQFVVTAIPDGGGGAILGWEDNRTIADYDVYAHRILASGAVDSRWPVDGRSIASITDGVTGDEVGPFVSVSDGAHGAIFGWSSYGAGDDYDVYAKRVFADGALDPAWPAGGRVLCDASGDQVQLSLTADYAGGAIAAWMDARGFDDIYAQRVNPSGSALWAANGIAVYSDAMDQAFPQVAAVGGGGSVITWQDQRAGNFDIYVQKLAGNGQKLYPANGLAFCTAANDQVFPRIVSTDRGDAIVCWQDSRTELDVYAMRLRTSMVGVESEVGDAVQLGPALPNPADRLVAVRCDLPRASRVHADVYDVMGQHVRTLAADEFAAGAHRFAWDRRNDAGETMASGVYFIRVSVNGQHSQRKVVLTN